MVRLSLMCIQLTTWYPVQLYRTIRLVTPRVDHYTELGKLRGQHEMNREYQRLLDRDTNPLNFMYNGESYY